MTPAASTEPAELAADIKADLLQTILAARALLADLKAENQNLRVREEYLLQRLNWIRQVAMDGELPAATACREIAGQVDFILAKPS